MCNSFAKLAYILIQIVEIWVIFTHLEVVCRGCGYKFKFYNIAL